MAQESLSYDRQSTSMTVCITYQMTLHAEHNFSDIFITFLGGGWLKCLQTFYPTLFINVH